MLGIADVLKKQKEKTEKMEEEVSPILEEEPEETEAPDPHNLRRFTSKQVYYQDQALREIKNGRKSSCWMWYVIPTPPWIVNGEERGSYTNQLYSVRSDEQALAYLKFVGDGQNLRNNYLDIMQAILQQVKGGRDPVRLIGMVDYPKMISSVKYFNKICANGVDDEIYKVTKELLPLIPEKKKKKKSAFSFMRRSKKSKSEDTESDEDEQFKVGDQVFLKGLTGRYKKFNGKKGKVTGKGLRNFYTIKAGLHKVSAKAHQMIVIQKPKISEKTLVDTKEGVQKKQEEPGKSIDVDSKKEEPFQLFKEGDRVRFDSHLQDNLNLYGKIGVISGKLNEKNRYPVKFEGVDETSYILPKFLSLSLIIEKNYSQSSDAMDVEQVS